MNKYLKGCLFVVVTILVLFLVLFLFFIYSLNHNRKDSSGDSIKYSKVCDTIQNINEKPTINFEGFDKTEIDKLKFHLVRHKKIIRDTTLIFDTANIDKYFFRLNIPFDNLTKTDTVVLMTKNKKYFSISGFHYYAYLHYGNFGYLGSYECRFANDNYIVNGKKIVNGTLDAKESLAEMPK